MKKKVLKLKKSLKKIPSESDRFDCLTKYSIEKRSVSTTRVDLCKQLNYTFDALNTDKPGTHLVHTARNSFHYKNNKLRKMSEEDIRSRMTKNPSREESTQERKGLQEDTRSKVSRGTKGSRDEEVPRVTKINDDDDKLSGIGEAASMGIKLKIVPVRPKEEDVKEEVIETHSKPSIEQSRTLGDEEIWMQDIVPTEEEKSGVTIHKQVHTPEESFPLADSAVMEEIKEAERRAKEAVSSINKMRKSITLLTEKEELTQEEMDELQAKQAKIVAKLNEFEAITKKMQNLLGLASVESAQISVAPTAPPTVPPSTSFKTINSENLPKVIIPPGTSDQVPKIIVCEPIKKTGSHAVYQQFSGKKGDSKKDACKDVSHKTWEQDLPYQAQPDLSPHVHWSHYPQKQQCPQMPQMQQMPGMSLYPTPAAMPSFPPVQQPYLYPHDPGIEKDNIFEHLSGRLDESYRMQEKLVQENADMEGDRYQLQEELLNKDQTVESLQKQMESMQNEMKAINTENAELKERLKICNTPQPCQKSLCKQSLGKDPICKLDLYKQMGLPIPTEGPGYYSITGKAGDAKDMDTLVEGMEEEVRAMQKELIMVQEERRSLDLQKKLLKCAEPKAGAPITFPICKRRQQQEPVNLVCIPQFPLPPCTTTPGQPAVPVQVVPPPPPPPSPKLQTSCLRELEGQLKEIKEQYQRLQEDFNKKVTEISVLRVEMENARKERNIAVEKAAEAEARVDDLLCRLKVVENEKSKMADCKDQLIELEQQMILAKQRYCEGQDEVDEMRVLIQEQALQIEDYRNKYIGAQEIVEEQRRQIDQMEINSSRFSEQLNKELQQVKAEFQKRLEELSPLPDLLKTAQTKLQESEQLRIIAEHTCEEITNELEEIKEKLQIMEAQAEKCGTVSTVCNEEDAKAEILKLKAIIARLEEMALENERKLDEKNQLVIQFQSQLEIVREESARQVTKTKDRCEVVRKGLQTQICDLELQLAQSRATARAAHRDRDEIRLKMEAQIGALTKNFEQAQGWVRCLQSHVQFLKSSNKNVLFPGKEVHCLPKAIDPANFICNEEQT